MYFLFRYYGRGNVPEAFPEETNANKVEYVEK